MSIKLIAGKTYLFDNRNGNIHQFEQLLSQMSYMVPIVAKKGMKLPPLAREVPGAYTQLSPVDKANEWDRLARLPKAKREAEETKKVEAAELAKQPEDPEVEGGENTPSDVNPPINTEPTTSTLENTQPADDPLANVLSEATSPQTVPKPPAPPATE